MFITSRPITTADYNALECILSKIQARQTIVGTQKIFEIVFAIKHIGRYLLVLLAARIAIEWGGGEQNKTNASTQQLCVNALIYVLLQNVKDHIHYNIRTCNIYIVMRFKRNFRSCETNVRRCTM